MIVYFFQMETEFTSRKKRLIKSIGIEKHAEEI